MNLAHAYAQVIKSAQVEGHGAEFTKKLLAYMKSRGHLSLLFEVVRIAKRDMHDPNQAVVTVAKEGDARKFHSQIKEALSLLGDEAKKHVTIVNPDAVGGYSVRVRSQLVDRTHRNALVSVYKNTIRS